jgi:hypothetical protein
MSGVGQVASLPVGKQAGESRRSRPVALLGQAVVHHGQCTGNLSASAAKSSSAPNFAGLALANRRIYCPYVCKDILFCSEPNGGFMPLDVECQYDDVTGFATSSCEKPPKAPARAL